MGGAKGGAGLRGVGRGRGWVQGRVSWAGLGVVGGHGRSWMQGAGLRSVGGVQGAWVDP